MVSENQQQEFELLTDDDDWSDSPKAGKKNSLWNTNAVVVKSKRPADGENQPHLK